MGVNRALWGVWIRFPSLAPRARAGSEPWHSLTRCCSRLLTATAAADAALCRSSAACPGRSRLRVNLRVRSPAMALGAGRSRAGPQRASPWLCPRQPSRPTRRSGSGTRGLSTPFFLALLARGGFFSPAHPPTPPPPFLGWKLRLDFSKNSARFGTRARLAGSAGGPRAGGGAVATGGDSS